VDGDAARTAGRRPRIERLQYASARGRWALAAVILGSGAAFLESSVVTVAPPAIGRGRDLEFGGLQRVMNGYLLALSALIITGGSLGDLYAPAIASRWRPCQMRSRRLSNAISSVPTTSDAELGVDRVLPQDPCSPHPIEFGASPTQLAARRSTRQEDGLPIGGRCAHEPMSRPGRRSEHGPQGGHET
jgi:hypothetical protein